MFRICLYLVILSASAYFSNSIMLPPIRVKGIILIYIIIITVARPENLRYAYGCVRQIFSTGTIKSYDYNITPEANGASRKKSQVGGLEPLDIY